VTDPR